MRLPLLQLKRRNNNNNGPPLSLFDQVDKLHRENSLSLHRKINNMSGLSLSKKQASPKTSSSFSSIVRLVIYVVAFLLFIRPIDFFQWNTTSNNNNRDKKQHILTSSSTSLKSKRDVPRRMKEVDAMQDLQTAFSHADEVVQPPLGAGTSLTDPSLLNYSKDFRGTDLSRPENEIIRSNRMVYMITPTHQCKTQIVDLKRLSQTLRLAKEAGYHNRLYWIILEDADFPSKRVRQIAEQSGLAYAHKAVPTSKEVRNRKAAHRGLEQRNVGLDTVEQVGAEGVVYFMDDDNAYDVQLFHELAYATNIGVFGVGMPGGSAYERCHVDPETGKVDKLLTTWAAKRMFPIDMAGFCFATHHLARATASGNKLRFTPRSKPGFLENDFLSFIAGSVSEMEPLAANCTRILTWHVKTVGNDQCTCMLLFFFPAWSFILTGRELTTFYCFFFFTTASVYNPEEGKFGSSESSPKFQLMMSLL